MTKFYYYLHLSILILIGVSAFFYFNFTAEDAYITYRYAENWVNLGSLVYNEGEPINAMTSPLHAVLSAAFFSVTGNTVLSNKIFSFVLLLISTLLVWYRYREHLHFQVLGLILLIPPSVLLWTFGGLETPILLFLATLSVILVLRPHTFNLNLLCVVLLLAGLAFLTRYDSILFFFPVALYATSKAQSIKDVVVAMGIWLISGGFPISQIRLVSITPAPKVEVGVGLHQYSYISLLTFAGWMKAKGISVSPPQVWRTRFTYMLPGITDLVSKYSWLNPRTVGKAGNNLRLLQVRCRTPNYPRHSISTSALIRTASCLSGKVGVQRAPAARSISSPKILAFPGAIQNLCLRKC